MKINFIFLKGMQKLIIIKVTKGFKSLKLCLENLLNMENYLIISSKDIVAFIKNFAFGSRDYFNCH